MDMICTVLMGYISRPSTKHTKHKADRRKLCKEGGGRASRLRSPPFRNTCEKHSNIPAQTVLSSSPGVDSGCGLNSRFWAINGQTIQSERGSTPSKGAQKQTHTDLLRILGACPT